MEGPTYAASLLRGVLSSGIDVCDGRFAVAGWGGGRPTSYDYWLLIIGRQAPEAQGGGGVSRLVMAAEGRFCWVLYGRTGCSRDMDRTICKITPDRDQMLYQHSPASNKRKNWVPEMIQCMEWEKTLAWLQSTRYPV